ncbi:carbamoyl-phosphate synthase large subunit [Pueribacillus theae]|uniref:Carbamoyl phosphate synthase large chain n=1 Tax=Pueribacillus theae TaxID=2171751 RepID=A0A2U1K667_9BACI|nr:carbamoyl phosphate synthase large subunit [Pueribacillus theae]PWA12745.1 carbamoyl-phosphate synthase large subunit [Pueribacillus theae]
MPRKKEIKKVLVIGSGPIIIGQAAEFDYAGTQACLALKEEGCEVVLINNNPATIMTDEDFADTVYFEPLTVECVEAIIKKEKPDGLLHTVGGQTGLNLALELHRKGILQKYNVTVLGTQIDSIIKGEDREEFRALMHKLLEPVPESEIVTSLVEAFQFAEKVGYPIIVRPAYTLGGSGGGIAECKEELETYVKRGLKASPIHQCLIEKSIAGFKEIEYEVVRDANDTCIAVCDMENIDPVGIHTGDSLVVAPSQTLSDEDSSMLRSAAIKIVRSLGIVGGCNVQFALHPSGKHYFVIEVNPRVSRSSALASKATGYPIARVAAKVSLGYHLHELGTYAHVEPELDYTVVKIPRWPFDKFTNADRKLGTQMKATGEVMAIERNLESALQKAVRSLEVDSDGLSLIELKSFTTEKLWELVKASDDRRFFALFELLRRGESVHSLHEQTKITTFFLESMQNLVSLEQLARKTNFENVTKDELANFKENGFSDEWLGKIWGIPPLAVREKRKHLGITPVYKMIDTCPSEQSKRAYYYSTWNSTHDLATDDRKKVLIIGSGPIRIGQGIEFDYCSVHGVLALQKCGYETILINNNPETVSTDYEIADRLYFEPLSVEDVLNVIEFENIDGVIVQFGGQTAISLVKGLEEAGVTLLGSTLDVIDKLEDRDRFYQFMQTLNLPHIPGLTAVNKVELIEKAKEIGYPVLLRPSYVIGGKGMLVLTSEDELEAYSDNFEESYLFPILIDAYYPGKEVEVDVVTDGKNVIIPAIFEHIEKAGVHSGDSMAVTPPVSLSATMKQQIAKYAERIAKGIDFKGVFNIQFVIHDETLYVLEVNPRASRTVPIISKVTGVNMIELAAQVLIGKSLGELSSTLGLLPENDFYTIKAPVFSTMKLPGVDPKLVPEMKSTGELIAISKTLEDGYRKAFLWNESLSSSFSEGEKEIYIEGDFPNLEFFQSQLEPLGLKVRTETEFDKGTFIEWLKTDKPFAMISSSSDSQKRELALQYGLFVMSTVETAHVFAMMAQDKQQVHAIQQWKKTVQKEVVV